MTGAIAKEYGAKQVDEKIDDGTDKDGVYVMLRSFSVKGWHIRLYYTSDDGIITDADYMKD